MISPIIKIIEIKKIFQTYLPTKRILYRHRNLLNIKKTKMLIIRDLLQMKQIKTIFRL
jgi:hypothetical protein